MLLTQTVLIKLGFEKSTQTNLWNYLGVDVLEVEEEFFIPTNNSKIVNFWDLEEYITSKRGFPLLNNFQNRSREERTKDLPRLIEEKGEMMLYADIMEEIKVRISFVQDSLSTNLNEDVKSEIIAIQFRKIIECIIFSSLATNKKIFTQKFEVNKPWRIATLIEKMKQMNPKYFPIPYKFVPPVFVPNYGFVPPPPPFTKVAGALTENDLIIIHNACNNVLHFINPFIGKTKKEDYKYILDNTNEWKNKIIKLLSIHFSHQTTGELYYVEMQSKNLRNHVNVQLATFTK